MAERGVNTHTQAKEKELAGRRSPRLNSKPPRGIASEVLSMDGPPPDHERKCKCDTCNDHRQRRCKCVKVHDAPLPAECVTFGESTRFVHCRVCG